MRADFTFLQQRKFSYLKSDVDRVELDFLVEYLDLKNRHNYSSYTILSYSYSHATLHFSGYI